MTENGDQTSSTGMAAHSSLGQLSWVQMMLRKIETSGPVSAAEKTAIGRLPAQFATIARGQDIVREGECPGRCFVVLQGIVGWYKVTERGGRQIAGLHIPGDIPDLQSLHLEVLDATLATFSDCRVAFFPHDALQQLCLDFPRLNTVLWRQSLIDAAIFREWVVNIGARQGMARVAHLFCEVFTRLAAIGLAKDQSCDISLTQTEIGEATGLSTVHVNRVLQTLRAKKLVALNNRQLTILDWDGLRAIGDFEPGYLHLHLTGTDPRTDGVRFDNGRGDGSRTESISDPGSDLDPSTGN